MRMQAIDTHGLSRSPAMGGLGQRGRARKDEPSCGACPCCFCRWWWLKWQWCRSWHMLNTRPMHSIPALPCVVRSLASCLSKPCAAPILAAFQNSPFKQLSQTREASQLNSLNMDTIWQTLVHQCTPGNVGQAQDSSMQQHTRSLRARCYAADHRRCGLLSCLVPKSRHQAQLLHNAGHGCAWVTLRQSGHRLWCAPLRLGVNKQCPLLTLSSAPGRPGRSACSRCMCR